MWSSIPTETIINERTTIQFLCDLKASHIGMAWFGKQIAKLTFLWPRLYVQGKVAAHLLVGRWWAEGRCIAAGHIPHMCAPESHPAAFPILGPTGTGCEKNRVQWPDHALQPRLVWDSAFKCGAYQICPTITHYKIFSHLFGSFYKLFVELLV